MAKRGRKGKPPGEIEVKTRTLKPFRINVNRKIKVSLPKDTCAVRVKCKYGNVQFFSRWRSDMYDEFISCHDEGEKTICTIGDKAVYFRKDVVNSRPEVHIVCEIVS